MPAAPILVTGAAGFIGYHVARRLLRDGRTVVGLDNLNAYYDPALKEARLAELVVHPAFRFSRLDLADRQAWRRSSPRTVSLCRPSRRLKPACDIRWSTPMPMSKSNLVGFVNVLEGCRHNGCQHLLYASSSSVFGANTHQPFSVHDNVDHPLNLYGATKKCNELMAHSYAHLFGLPTTGLRFFTVYGPWNRPDMAMWLFADAITAGRPIQLFNHGSMRRDFTYVDDVVESIVRLIDQRHDPIRMDRRQARPCQSTAPWRVYNIGNHSPVEVLEVVALLEEASAPRPSASSCRCSRAMSRQPMPMSRTWCARSISSRRPRSLMASAGSSTGSRPIIARRDMSTAGPRLKFLANLSYRVKIWRKSMRRKAITAPVAGLDCRQRPHLPAPRATPPGVGHEFFDRMHGFAPIAHGIGVVSGAHVGAVQAIVALDRANEADIRVQRAAHPHLVVAGVRQFRRIGADLVLQGGPQHRRRRRDRIADLAAEFQKAGAGQDVGLIVLALLAAPGRSGGIFPKDIGGTRFS